MSGMLGVVQVAKEHPRQSSVVKYICAMTMPHAITAGEDERQEILKDVLLPLESRIISEINFPVDIFKSSDEG